jgi:hypothetical protein
MADKPLDFLSFILGVSTDGDATRSNPDPVGYFYCRKSTARFLDIEKFASTGSFKKKRKGFVRTRTLADGTVLGGKDAQVAETEFEVNAKARGMGKNIKLITGKKTSKGNYQTISFNFPGFATSLVIGEALGELIPVGKINKPGSNVSATEIFPYFITPSGKRGSIRQQAAAISSTAASVGLNPATRLALAAKLGAIYLAGAGE